MVDLSNQNDNFSNSYFVLDFDRCIADTEKFHSIFERIVERETSITPGDMSSVKDSIQGKGGTFDTVDYIQKALSDREDNQKTWNELQSLFIKEAQSEDLLQPHARELLSILKSRKIPHGIITYGKEAWQLAKIEAAGLIEVPHIVTSIQEKGLLLDGWKHDDVFIIPPAMTDDFQALTVERVIFLDDKAVSFHDIPNGVFGVQVQPAVGEMLPSQRGILPSGVKRVKGLDGAIKLLFGS